MFKMKETPNLKRGPEVLYLQLAVQRPSFDTVSVLSHELPTIRTCLAANLLLKNAASLERTKCNSIQPPYKVSCAGGVICVLAFCGF